MKALDPTTFKQFFGPEGLSQPHFEANLEDFLWNESYHIEIVLLYTRTTNLPPNEFDNLISKMQSYFPYTVFDKVHGAHDHIDCPDDFFSQAISSSQMHKEGKLHDKILQTPSWA